MKTTTLVALFLLTVAPFVLAQGTYTQIDPPGSIYTIALGIDDTGDVVGYYEDTAIHGFLLSGGVYGTFDVPGADGGTYATDINNKGLVSGYSVSGGIVSGFLYDVQNATFTTITFPGSLSTYVTGLNDHGTLIGYAALDAGVVGFQSSGGTFKKVSPQGEHNSVLTGINNSRVIVGDAETKSNQTTSFSYYEGQFHTVTIPKQSAYVNGVNDQRSVVGVYLPSSGVYDGFLYADRTLTTLLFPGASNYTSAQGINNGGEVVGYFHDASNNYHGYTWTPPAPAEKK